MNNILGLNKTILSKFKNNVDLNIAIKRSLDVVKKNKSYTNIQNKILNFYDKKTISPYIPAAAQGPWIVTMHGKVLYDVGGYGMLGYGHSPKWILDILGKPHVMANVMTPNLEQQIFSDLLQEKIGINRKEKCPYSHFAFLNSGSEAIELASRITDINTKKIQKKTAFLVLKNSFHGRTKNAALFSNSCRKSYDKYLKSYNTGIIPLIVPLEINNNENLLNTYNKLLKENYHVEAMIMEPVMGEGNPGTAVNTEFYKLARQMTKKNNTVLIIDSIQAGIRTNGCLSMIDYKKLLKEDPPDMEIFSKAINSGHYPLSVLAMQPHIYDSYRTGLYGNTMTSNPKALSIGIETLSKLTPQISNNIQIQGKKFKNMLIDLQIKYPKIISDVTGTGLLLALHLNKKFPVVEKEGLEFQCRKYGLNVIHGGENALRFTPYFLINEEEINLIISILDYVLSEITYENQSK